MRRVLAVAVFSSLAMSGYAQAPGRSMTGLIDQQGQFTNIRLVFPDGTELRAERMTLADGKAEASMEEMMLMLAGRKPVSASGEFVLSGDVRLTFSAR